MCSAGRVPVAASGDRLPPPGWRRRWAVHAELVGAWLAQCPGQLQGCSWTPGSGKQDGGECGRGPAQAGHLSTPERRRRLRAAAPALPRSHPRLCTCGWFTRGFFISFMWLHCNCSEQPAGACARRVSGVPAVKWNAGHSRWVIAARPLRMAAQPHAPPACRRQRPRTRRATAPRRPRCSWCCASPLRCGGRWAAGRPVWGGPAGGRIGCAGTQGSPTMARRCASRPRTASSPAAASRLPAPCNAHPHLPG